METRATISDPAARGGFREYDGIKVAVIGDDPDTMLALGHHSTEDVLRVFERLAKDHLDWDELPNNEPEQRWATFTETTLDHDWWCDNSVDQETPGAIPVTVLDCY